MLNRTKLNTTSITNNIYFITFCGINSLIFLTVNNLVSSIFWAFRLYPQSFHQINSKFRLPCPLSHKKERHFYSSAHLIVLLSYRLISFTTTQFFVSFRHFLKRLSTYKLLIQLMKDPMYMHLYLQPNQRLFVPSYYILRHLSCLLH